MIEHSGGMVVGKALGQGLGATSVAIAMPRSGGCSHCRPPRCARSCRSCVTRFLGPRQRRQRTKGDQHRAAAPPVNAGLDTPELRVRHGLGAVASSPEVLVSTWLRASASGSRSTRSSDRAPSGRWLPEARTGGRRDRIAARGGVRFTRPDRSAADLVRTVSDDLRALVSEELRNARDERGVSSRRAGRAGVLLGAAAGLGVLATGCRPSRRPKRTLAALPTLVRPSPGMTSDRRLASERLEPVGPEFPVQDTSSVPVARRSLCGVRPRDDLGKEEACRSGSRRGCGA
jgi:hypothetical protein